MNFSRIIIAGYAIGLNLVNHFRRKQRSSDRAMIIFQQVFGDAVVLTSALDGYVECLVRRQGMKLVLVCKPAIAQFLKEVATLPQELEIRTVDFKRLMDDFWYFRRIVHEYSMFADIALTPGDSLSAELLSTTLRAKRRIGVLPAYIRTWPPQMVVFQRLAFTETIQSEEKMMMIQRHRLLLHHLGMTDYKGKLPQLQAKVQEIVGRYCVVCPGASTEVKRWPSERFAVIVDYIVECYDMDIHICGGADESDIAQRMRSQSRYPDRIIDHTGKTGFSSWSAIVEHAQLVIGNDSATLHIAAAHRCRAICIAGIYDKWMFFPYLVDELDEGDRLPETLLVDWPCAFCRTKGYFAGYKRPDCKRVIDHGECALCISAITTDMVKEKIDKLMNA